MYQFKKISIKNRLGEAMDVLVHPLRVSAGRIYILLTLPKNIHASAFSKNAEYIAHQLRQSYASLAKGFSLIEMRHEKECSGLIELDTLISDNTVINWSVYERKKNLQTIPTLV